MKGIFYNSQQSLCSIWESGKMCYDALKKSNNYYLDYTEEKQLNYSYDFVVINYHHQVNNWITFDIIKKFRKPTFCIVTEVTFDVSPIKMSPDFFNHYIVLDPTINENNRIHAFGRPLEDFNLNITTNQNNDTNVNSPDVNSVVSADVNSLVSADVNPVVSADVNPVVSADVNPVVSADVSPVVSADVNADVGADVGADVSADVSADVGSDKIIEISNYKDEQEKIIKDEIPKIGSFGFATPGKEWCRLIQQVQQEFDYAKIHFNIPKGTHVPNHVHNQIIREIYLSCKKIIKKPGILMRITSLNLSKQELIKLCSEKTINCFFYNRDHLYSAGLSAVTDQAISSGKPLLVTGDRTFRHIHKYIPHFPNISIKKAIETSQEGVLKMKNDWSSTNFCLKFEKILFMNK